MRGTILGVHDGRGVLSSADERRLGFPLSEWRSPGTPTAGQIVDYVEEGGEARAVFAAPGAARQPSGAMVLGAVALGCLALGFIVPLIPTVTAFVLGVIGAGQAQAEHDTTALLLSRTAWIGALVLLGVGVLVLLAVTALIGAVGFASIFHGLGPANF